MQILIVEDDAELNNSITRYLQNKNYLCESAFDFATAVSKMEVPHYGCILLSLNLPQNGTYDILKKLKKRGWKESIIIISQKNSQPDKKRALNLGANSCIEKPFRFSQLYEDIKTIVRHKKFHANTILEFNGLKLDTQNGQAFVNHSLVELRSKEFQLLLYLASNDGKVISHQCIMHELSLNGEKNTRTIYTHIKNLKKKLCKLGKLQYIKTVYGMGYRFTDKS